MRCSGNAGWHFSNDCNPSLPRTLASSLWKMSKHPGSDFLSLLLSLSFFHFSNGCNPSLPRTLASSRWKMSKHPGSDFLSTNGVSTYKDLCLWHLKVILRTRLNIILSVGTSMERESFGRCHDDHQWWLGWDRIFWVMIQVTSYDWCCLKSCLISESVKLYWKWGDLGTNKLKTQFRWRCQLWCWWEWW